MPWDADRTIAGGGAGMMEALVCHPLGMLSSGLQSIRVDMLMTATDTIKVRMQLSKRAKAPGVSCHENQFEIQTSI